LGFQNSTKNKKTKRHKFGGGGGDVSGRGEREGD